VKRDQYTAPAKLRGRNLRPGGLLGAALATKHIDFPRRIEAKGRRRQS